MPFGGIRDYAFQHMTRQMKQHPGELQTMVGNEETNSTREGTQGGRGQFPRPGAIIFQRIEAHQPSEFARIDTAFVAQDDELLIGLETGQIRTELVRLLGLKGMKDQFEVGCLAQ